MSYSGRRNLEDNNAIGMKAMLGAIGSTEESTFSEVCQGLGDLCPSGENGIPWSHFFAVLNTAVDRGWVKTSKCGTRIDSLILTSDGVAELQRLNNGGS